MLDWKCRFSPVIEQAYLKLQTIGEQHASLPYRPEGWTRKEVLGHLIDSCLNNHQRFVRAALQSEFHGPTYAQREWVDMHGYKEISWSALIDCWIVHNRLLGEVVRRIPEDKDSVPCFIGENPVMSLGALIEDYLAHVQGHLEQIYS